MDQPAAARPIPKRGDVAMHLACSNAELAGDLSGRRLESIRDQCGHRREIADVNKVGNSLPFLAVHRGWLLLPVDDVDGGFVAALAPVGFFFGRHAAYLSRIKNCVQAVNYGLEGRPLFFGKRRLTGVIGLAQFEPVIQGQLSPSLAGRRPEPKPYCR